MTAQELLDRLLAADVLPDEAYQELREGVGDDPATILQEAVSTDLLTDEDLEAV